MPITTRCQVAPLFISQLLRAVVFPAEPRRASHATALGACVSCTRPALLPLSGRLLAFALPVLAHTPLPCTFLETTSPSDTPGSVCRHLLATGCPPLGLCRGPLAPVLPLSGHGTHPTPCLAVRWCHRYTLGVPCPSVRLSGSPAGMSCLGCVSAYWGFLLAPTGPYHSRLPGGHLLSVLCRILGPCRGMTRLWSCDPPCGQWLQGLAVR
jgi:hypothetical protein